MNPTPLGLSPLIGYLIWHVQRGQTGAEALEEARNNPTYSGFSDADYNTALYAALHNVAITEQAEKLTGERQIGEAAIPGIPPFGGPVPFAVSAEECFGVRYNITHTDPSGLQSVASVVINVPAKTTIDQIDKIARDWFVSGQHTTRSGHASPGTWGAGGIAQVVRGGYPGAVINNCQ